MLVLITVVSCVACALLILTLAWTITNLSRLSKSKASSQDVDLLLDHINGLSQTVHDAQRKDRREDRRVAGRLRASEDELAVSNVASAAIASAVDETTEDVDSIRATLWDTAHTLDHVRHAAGSARRELTTIKKSLSPYIHGDEAGWELNAEDGYSMAPEFRARRLTISSAGGGVTKSLRVDPATGALEVCDPRTRRCSSVLTADRAGDRRAHV